MSEHLLEITNLSFSYVKCKPVLNNISLRMKKGECICLLGESGIGKTTLFRLIQGHLTPSIGSIKYMGRPTCNFEIACVMQNYTLFPHFSALKNVELVLRRKQNFWKRIFPDQSIQQQAMDYLKQVNMEDCATQLPYTLSGGQRQRIAIAQALAQQSPLILMDEPFGALDEKIREELQALLIQLQQKHNLGILFITHNLEEALYLSQKLYLLREIKKDVSNLEEYSIWGIIHDAPEIKQSEEFFKHVQALRNHMFRQQSMEMHPEKIQQPLQRGLIDESILAQLEQQADEIWVITPDLRQDVHNHIISQTVRANLDKGKHYRYITPHSSTEADCNIAHYKEKFSSFERQYVFSTLPPDDPVFLFGEVVIYNPKSVDVSGFTYLQGHERGMMVALPEKFLKAYVKRIGVLT